MNLAATCSILLLAGASGIANADEWRFWLGVHDYNVPDVDSHTYGITGGGWFDKQSASGRHYFGGADLFADRDEDELDPDHIPFRWDVHLGTDGNLWKGARTYIDWTANVDTRMNTVSSVEREITALPAIVARYEGKFIEPSLKAGAGWFFLEIDDDVPKTRGYDRSDFRNSTLGYSVAADVKIRIGECCKVDVLEMQDGEQAGGEAGVRGEAGEGLRGVSPAAAGFPEHGVAGGQGLRGLHAGEEEAVVGRREEQHPPEGLPPHLGLDSGQPGRPALGPQAARREQPGGLPLQEPAGIGERHHLRGQDLGRRPALLSPGRPHQLRGPFRNPVTEPADDPQPFRQRTGRPGALSVLHQLASASSGASVRRAARGRLRTPRSSIISREVMRADWKITGRPLPGCVPPPTR